MVSCAIWIFQFELCRIKWQHGILEKPILDTVTGTKRSERNGAAAQEKQVNNYFKIWPFHVHIPTKIKFKICFFFLSFWEFSVLNILDSQTDTKHIEEGFVQTLSIQKWTLKRSLKAHKLSMWSVWFRFAAVLMSFKFL